MDQDVKKRWVEALRSGNYKQGMNYLRTSNSFCCLGVLCNIIAPRAWEDLSSVFTYSHFGEDCIPSHFILEKAGISRGQAGELSGMNDEGESFESIADHIEKNL